MYEEICGQIISLDPKISTIEEYDDAVCELKRFCDFRYKGHWACITHDMKDKTSFALTNVNQSKVVFADHHHKRVYALYKTSSRPIVPIEPEMKKNKQARIKQNKTPIKHGCDNNKTVDKDNSTSFLGRSLLKRSLKDHELLEDDTPQKKLKKEEERDENDDTISITAERLYDVGNLFSYSSDSSVCNEFTVRIAFDDSVTTLGGFVLDFPQKGHQSITDSLTNFDLIKARLHAMLKKITSSIGDGKWIGKTWLWNIKNIDKVERKIHSELACK